MVLYTDVLPAGAGDNDTVRVNNGVGDPDNPTEAVHQQLQVSDINQFRKFYMPVYGTRHYFIYPVIHALPHSAILPYTAKNGRGIFELASWTCR